MPSKGNIVLYQSYGPSFAEEGETLLVQRLTNGPFVHAAILTDDSGNLIEARTDGVHRGRLNNNVNGSSADKGRVICTIWTANKTPDGHVIALSEQRVDSALSWLQAQADAGDPYSWSDVVSTGLGDIWPGLPAVSQPGRYDCSNLACTFLFLAGVTIPFKPPFETSPNDLAQFFGLLPNRKKVLR